MCYGHRGQRQSVDDDIKIRNEWTIRPRNWHSRFPSTEFRNGQPHSNGKMTGIIEIVGFGDGAPLRWIVIHFARDTAQRITAFDQPCGELWVNLFLGLFPREKLFERDH